MIWRPGRYAAGTPSAAILPFPLGSTGCVRRGNYIARRLFHGRIDFYQRPYPVPIQGLLAAVDAAGANELWATTP